MRGETSKGDDAESERQHAAWEKQLLFPYMEAELDWLRRMQDAIVDAGLKQIAIRKYCILFNIASVGVVSWMLLTRDTEPNLFWIVALLLANFATVGAYLSVAIGLASFKSVLSRINERARTNDSRLYGEMSVGSAIEKRIC
jgi:hypothetical protein